MLAGVAELANLCDAEGDSYLDFDAASRRCKWLRVYGAKGDYEELVAFMVAADVDPVPGRQPWAAASVKAGSIGDGAPPGFGDVARAARQQLVTAKLSGDGGRQLAAQLGLCDRAEWEPEPGDAASDASHIPPSPAAPAARSAPRARVAPAPSASAAAGVACAPTAAPAAAGAPSAPPAMPPPPPVLRRPTYHTQRRPGQHACGY